MGKRDNRPAVERRIGKALRYWEEGNMEDALFEIAPTIDVVAKKRYPEKKRVGARVKAFIFNEQALIYFLSKQGKIKLPDEVRIVMVESGNEKNLGAIHLTIEANLRISYITIFDALSLMRPILTIGTLTWGDSLEFVVKHLRMMVNVQDLVYSSFRTRQYCL